MFIPNPLIILLDFIDGATATNLSWTISKVKLSRARVRSNQKAPTWGLFTAWYMDAEALARIGIHVPYQRDLDPVG